jgi:hypothetical protein
MMMLLRAYPKNNCTIEVIADKNRCFFVVICDCAYRKKKSLGTIRHIPDELWNEVKNILSAEKLPKTKGCPIVPF